MPLQVQLRHNLQSWGIVWEYEYHSVDRLTVKNHESHPGPRLATKNELMC